MVALTPWQFRQFIYVMLLTQTPHTHRHRIRNSSIHIWEAKREHIPISHLQLPPNLTLCCKLGSCSQPPLLPLYTSLPHSLSGRFREYWNPCACENDVLSTWCNVKVYTICICSSVGHVDDVVSAGTTNVNCYTLHKLSNAFENLSDFIGVEFTR